MSILDAIAQGVRPPQIDTPVEYQTKLANLQHLQQQIPLQQQALQTATLENQQRQMALDQTQAINVAYRNAFTVGADGKATLDTGKLTTALSTAGHGGAIPGILEKYTQYQKSQADLQEAQQKIASSARDAAGSLGAAVDQANNDPHLFLTLVKHSVQTHDMDPNSAATMTGPIEQALQQDPTGESARAVVAQTTKNLIAQSPKQRELANATLSAQGLAARGTAATTTANRGLFEANRADAAADLSTATSPADYMARLGQWQTKNKDVAALFPQDPSKLFGADGKPDDDAMFRVRAKGMKPAEIQTALKAPKESNPTEASLAAVAEDMSRPAEERDAAKRALKRIMDNKPAMMMNIGIPGFSGNKNTELHGEEYLATLPLSMRNQVRALAEGRESMPTGIALSKPYWQNMQQALFNYDPDWSEQRAQARKAFGPGTPEGRNTGNLNTGVVHLDQLEEAAKAMANGSFVPGNEIYNKIRGMFGSAMPTNYQALQAVVAGELAQAYKGNATDPEIASIKEATSKVASPNQMTGFIETHLHALGAKLNTKHEMYQQYVPGDKIWSPVLPSAKSVFTKHGFDPLVDNPAHQGAPQASNGMTFKRTATGPNNHKIGTNDVDASGHPLPNAVWVDVVTGKNI